MFMRTTLYVLWSFPVALGTKWWQQAVYISPVWKSFGGLDLGQGTSFGILDVQFEWNLTRQKEWNDESVDMRDAISATNFLTGNPGRVKLLTVDYEVQWSMPSGVAFSQYERRSAAMEYTGAFSQVVDSTCYPWDEQRVSIRLEVTGRHRALPAAFLAIYCPRDRSSCSAYDAGGRLLTNTDTDSSVHVPISLPTMCPDQYPCSPVQKIILSDFEGLSVKGFTWSALTCEVASNALEVTCSMSGTRGWKRVFLVQALPGIVLMSLGFGSTRFPLEMTMPRVATTMIALLSLVSKSISVMATMPSSGTSWMEEFYVFGTVCMFLNMILHIVAFRCKYCAHFLDDVSFYILLSTYILIMTIRLHVRECPSANATVVLVVVAFAACGIVAFLGMIVRRYRTHVPHEPEVQNTSAETKTMVPQEPEAPIVDTVLKL